MKRTIIAFAVLSVVTAAQAAPTGSAYDRIQDARADATRDLINDHQDQITQNKVDSESRDAALNTRITGVDADLQSTKLGVLVVDQKADSALAESSAALNLAGEAKTDAQQALNGLAGKVDKTEYAADKAAQNTRDNLQDALIDTNGKKADAALQGVLSNGAALTGKVDKSDFLTDQQRQDDALTKETADRAAADRAQDVVTAQNYHDTTQKLATKVDTSTFIADQKRQDNLIANKVDNSTFQQRAADLDLRIAENRAAQQKTNQVVAGHSAQLANHEQRITSLEQQTNANFKDLRSQIDDNKREANAGIAGVAAIATIPQVTDKQDFSIGAGVGARDGESALAVGFSGRITPNVVTKVAVSTDSQSGWTVGAGMSYGW